MSGNSSVWRLISAAPPNATSATIAVTVMIGRLIAKSEMNIPCSCPPVRRLASARRSITGGGNANPGAWREPLRRVREQRVTHAHAGADLHLIGCVVAYAELHGHALDGIASDAQREGRDAS